MAKQTAAQRHTAAHKRRRADRLENRAQPQFEPGILFVCERSVIAADKRGNLIRIDPIMGSIRKLRWEQ